MSSKVKQHPYFNRSGTIVVESEKDQVTRMITKTSHSQHGL